jgi:hypothetical protein
LIRENRQPLRDTTSASGQAYNGAYSERNQHWLTEEQHGACEKHRRA